MKELVKKNILRNVILFCMLVLFDIILIISGNNVFKILASLSFVVAGMVCSIIFSGLIVTWETAL